MPFHNTPQGGLIDAQYPCTVSVAVRKWLWHKDREVVTYSYGSPRDIMIAIL